METREWTTPSNTNIMILSFHLFIIPTTPLIKYVYVIIYVYYVSPLATQKHVLAMPFREVSS